MPEYKIDSIFRDAAIRHSLEIFSDADIDAIEAAIFPKNGKPYLKREFCVHESVTTSLARESLYAKLF